MSTLIPARLTLNPAPRTSHLSHNHTARTLTVSAEELRHTAALIAELRNEPPEKPGLKAFFDELRSEREAIRHANDFLGRVLRCGRIA